MKEGLAARRPKAVLGGALLGATLFCALFAAVQIALPAQDDRAPGIDYGYVYSGAKSESIPFATAGIDDDTYLLFGSSELSTPKELVPQVPSAIFGEHNYGMRLMCVGEAYDQSLWQAIAAGAYGSADVPRKMAIIVSPAWFEDNGMDAETFRMKFSYPLYRSFCANENISDSTKNYVAQRLLSLGVGETVVRAGMREGVAGVINDWVFSSIDDLRLRADLIEVREKGQPLSQAEAVTPDFDELLWDARVEALVASTNNAWGMDDEFYAKNIEGRLDRLKGSQSDERFSKSEEYQDFSAFLKVCEEVGFQPLVIISPVHGEFYDHAGASVDDRRRCYDRIVQLCAENDVAVADFSDREYEDYFLHDIVHFGWTGWIEVEKAIYDYIMSEEVGAARG